MKNILEAENLTKDYGTGRGIFGVNLYVEQGEMMGFVGTNGSGKTTTIRSLMGFIKPTGGISRVNGLESWHNASEIARSVGYVPGEIAFPDLSTGIEFLKSQAELLGVKDLSYANELIEKLQLDPSANLKRMSKGMKQKTALVAALMSNAPIIILDEPTTGLDPLMRAAFLEIVESEHKKGKTIFMSSHMFDELEKTCDRVALISDGKILDIADMNEVRNRPVKDFKIEFMNKKDYEDFCLLGYNKIRLQPEYFQVTVSITGGDLNKLFSDLKKYDIKFLSEVKYTLEKHFKDILL